MTFGMLIGVGVVIGLLFIALELSKIAKRKDRY